VTFRKLSTRKYEHLFARACRVLHFPSQAAIDYVSLLPFAHSNMSIMTRADAIAEDKIYSVSDAYQHFCIVDMFFTYMLLLSYYNLISSTYIHEIKYLHFVCRLRMGLAGLRVWWNPIATSSISVPISKSLSTR
jgi:hypothetical protein